MVEVGTTRSQGGKPGKQGGGPHAVSLSMKARLFFAPPQQRVRICAQEGTVQGQLTLKVKDHLASSKANRAKKWQIWVHKEETVFKLRADAHKREW